MTHSSGKMNNPVLIDGMHTIQIFNSFSKLGRRKREVQVHRGFFLLTFSNNGCSVTDRLTAEILKYFNS